MEPIISPWYFYLAGIVEYVGWALKIGAFVLGFLAVAVLMDCEEESTKKLCILTGAIAVAMLFVAAFVPDKQTAYAMLAASVVTPDNIQAVQGNIVDFITDIAKSMQEVK